MKTVEQLKGEIFSEVQNSGFLKNVQSQVKAHVLDVQSLLLSLLSNKHMETKKN